MQMENGSGWEKTVRRMELLLRLKSFPVALKMLEKKEALNEIPFVRRPDHKVAMCQLITQVRTFDWTVGAELDDFLSPVCPSILGLTTVPEIYTDGTFRSIVWVKTRKDARKYEQSIPRIAPGKYEAVVLAPLVYNPFEPDLVLIYANPAQMMLLINALQFEDYEVMQFFCVGESSCADAVARCFLSGKPSLTIPCYGERRYGHAQDDELVMALPPAYMHKALAGLEALYRRGIRYPVSYAGAEQDMNAAFPAAYGRLDQVARIRGNDNRLVVGLTGGIATGKSTVARMLKELGSPVIDFDLLARRVVEPGRPAYRDIVAYFGEQVLQADKTLDRAGLSELVFRDLEKRKKLESFTHPRIYEEFFKELEQITGKDPDTIVQVDVPLLIELNLQFMFHKVLLVHLPAEQQIARLMARDNISEAEAERRLKAQLPINEKVGYADFVVRNDGTEAETRRQVEEIWKQLKELQAAKKAESRTEPKSLNRF